MLERNEIRLVTNPDKEKSEVVFYNAFQAFNSVEVLPDLCEMWRREIASLPDDKTVMDEVLSHAGLCPIPDTTKGLKTLSSIQQKRGRKVTSRKFVHNAHVDGLLHYNKPI